MKNTLFCLAFLGWLLTGYSQPETFYGALGNESLPDWARLMYEDPTNLDAIAASFRDYYEEREFVKNGHTQYYKRLLRERETYAFQFRDPRLTEEERRAMHQAEARYLIAYAQAQGSRDGNWTSMGPYDWDHDAAARSYAPGSAHVYTVEQCQANGNLVYAGTATAGLWKSTNGGGFWTNVTKDLAANNVYAVEIHPTNCSRVLAAMMEGIFLSTDEGATWVETGSFDFQSLNLSTRDIKYDRNGRVWAATNEGLFYSDNNGLAWTEKLSGNFQEIELHPTDGQVIYALHQTGDVTQFYKSSNGGTSFQQQTTGWPVPSGGDYNQNRRAEIAVSADAPNRVYALLTGVINGGSGLFGIYISEDAGASWTFTCCGPQPGGPPSEDNINMMGWSDLGLDDGGQYYYDLALAVDPNNADKVFVGGVNLWVSEDGGTTFTCPAKWSHPNKPEYVHADIHDVNYYANGELWVANDGGIFHSTDDGATFTRSSVGITGSDFWGFGVGFNDENVMLGGAYHNGTLLKNGDVYLNEWLCTDGGDGVGGAVNPYFADQVYSDYNIKTLTQDRTAAPSTRGYAMEPSWTYVTGRFSQIEFAGDNYNVHYFGRQTGLYKTEDDNNSVTQLYDFGEEVGDVEVSWTDPQTMYVATFPTYWGAKKIYRSTDGGLSWTDITPAATASSGVPYDVEVSYNDPNVIWAARIGRNTNASNKILKSTNGGDSWTDITNAALNGEVLTNVIAQRGTADHLYLGTTRTVYHSTTGGSGWTLLADGLPAAARSRQLAIGYRTGTLYNATNRSVWKTPLPEVGAVTPQMAVDKYYTACARDTFYFADHSTAPANAAFQWDFPGATWVSSTAVKDPKVVYGAPGYYSVSLTVGGNTQTLTDFVEVGQGCNPDNFAGRAMSAANSIQHFRSDNALDVTTNTITLMAWVKPAGIQDAYTGIIINDGAAAGMNFRADNQLAYHWSGGSTHWAWNSGLYVPADEWSFVVMVLDGDKLTFYLNEEEVTRTFAAPLDPVYWDRFRVGRYQSWAGRNLRGEMDEVLIWNRALSRDEIREWRHLTKHRQATPGDVLHDPDLLAYLQFNETGNPIYDRKGANHGKISDGTSLVASSAPVGDGTSGRQFVNAGGTYDFVDERLELVFPAGGTYPNGELVVTRLTNPPFVLPADPVNTDHYWIVNNYGTETFSELTSLTFRDLPGVDAAAAALPEQFLLHKRAANADELPAWGEALDAADAAVAGGTVTFSTDNGITNFSQLTVARDLSVLPVSFLDLWLTARDEKHVLVRWATAEEENVDYFAVERSADGRTFTEAGRVSAANRSGGGTYDFLDREALAGRNYYRVRAVDFDASFRYSPVRSIDLAGDGEWAEVYPNPLSGQDRLKVRSALTGVTIFELYAAGGRLLRRSQFENELYLYLPGLPAGTYTYRLTNGGAVATGKLVR